MTVVAVSLVMIGTILWIDIATGLWNELVVISGLAAGLVTFLLTALVLDKVIAHSTERKWAPVTRLALSDFLHALADEKHSEISRGHIVPRSLTPVESIADIENLHTMLHTLRHQVVEERRHLTDTLSRWAEFLSSSGSNDQLLRHIADFAQQLDVVRDTSIELEYSPTDENLTELNAATQRCNNLIIALETELRAQIDREDQLTRSRL